MFVKRVDNLKKKLYTNNKSIIRTNNKMTLMVENSWLVKTILKTYLSTLQMDLFPVIAVIK